ncbi:hypothetical protein ACOME3_008162 [Neoechinorhynchus agilis]
MSGISDFVCKMIIPDAPTKTSRIAAIVYVNSVDDPHHGITKVIFQEFRKTLSFQLGSIFTSPNHLSYFEFKSYRICVTALATRSSQSSLVNLLNKRALLAMDCTDCSIEDDGGKGVEVPMLQAKPTFSLFLYLLCVSLLAPLMLRNYWKKRSTQHYQSMILSEDKNEENATVMIDKCQGRTCHQSCLANGEDQNEEKLELVDRLGDSSGLKKTTCKSGVVDAGVAHILDSLQWRSGSSDEQ